MSRAEKRSGGRAGLVFSIAAIALLGIMGWLIWSSKDKAETDKLLTFECGADRVRFINSLGYIVEPDPEKEDIVIPQEFTPEYEEYNALQQLQGFDLHPYAGMEAIHYTYKVLNYPERPDDMVINLLFDDHRMIGADITCMDAENGFTKELIPEGYLESLKEAQKEVESTETEVTTAAE